MHKKEYHGKEHQAMKKKEKAVKKGDKSQIKEEEHK